MPGVLDSYRRQTGAPAPSGGGGGYQPTAPVDYDALDAAPTGPVSGDDESYMSGGQVAGLGAATALGGYLAYKTGIGWPALKAAGKGLAQLRMVSMLSGLAAPKSALGNAGAAFNVAMETGSMKPIKEQFSKQTAMDWLNEIRNPSPQAGTSVPGASRWNPFGRAMGAGDVATQNSLKRTGLVPAGEAERQTLQTALPPRIAHALENTPAKYAIPFRRTPVNQAIEGGSTVTDALAGPTVTRHYPGGEAYTAKTRLPLAVHTAGGAITGYASSDQQYPLPPGVYAAFAGRYGVPALIGAYLGRIYAGGRADSSIISSVLPVAEYGLGHALDPRNALEPLDYSKSALFRSYQRAFGPEQ